MYVQGAIFITDCPSANEVQVRVVMKNVVKLTDLYPQHKVSSDIFMCD